MNLSDGHVFVTLDAGSCHNGKLDLAMALIDEAAKAGADAIKFQLGVTAPNIPLPIEWWSTLCAHAHDLKIGCYASTFTPEITQWYLENHKGDPNVLKVAHSQRLNSAPMQKARNLGFEVWASSGCMDDRLVRKNADVLLFCVPEYPLLYDLRFEGLFPRFDGFSDHSLGIELAIEAVNHGARFIEKHLRLRESDCPDAAFALWPEEARNMIEWMREDFNG